MRTDDNLNVRMATGEDARALLALYAPYVERTAVSFELTVPSADEFRARIVNTLERYPWIVAECDREIVGYAYMGTFKERGAYDHSAEVSVYVREDKRRLGFGRTLYAALESEAKKRGILNLYACIAYTENDVPCLTRASLDFHLRLGYRLVGVFRKCGYKFGRFFDMAWMEKILPERTITRTTDT